MGFRCTFVSEDYPEAWPDWIVAKHEIMMSFGGCIASRGECSVFLWYDDGLFTDLQKAVNWDLWRVGAQRHDRPFKLVFFHECGGVTLCLVRPKTITFMQADQGLWKIVPWPDHSDACDHEFSLFESGCDIERHPVDDRTPQLSELFAKARKG